MRTKVEVSGKTYRVYTIDVGSGPKVYMDVRVATGPRAVIVSHFWRKVPPDSPVWSAVMAAVERKET